MKVSIIILHFGDVAVTKDCIDSLYAVESYPFSLIVVNNMPYDLHAKDFGRRGITIINNKKNLGFARGVNVGIKYALKIKSDAVLLLNNDTVIKKSILKILTKELEVRKDAGIVAPALVFKKNGITLFDLGGRLNHVFGRTSHKEVEKITKTQPIEVEYVSGCCMLIKSAVFKEVGFFDENFFLYYEDVDFCLRGKTKDLSCWVVPSVVIYHALSKSAGKMSYLATYHQIRSAILFGQKYFHGPILSLTNKLFIILQVALFLKASPTGGLGGLKALITSGAKNR